MGRPRIHDSDRLLDAAALMAATEGAATITMAGVAQATGAPSGSVYHLFPTRMSLLGELWLRTLRNFQDGYIDALGGEDPVRSCVAAGTHVVTWSREHQDEARILLYGSREFGAGAWPDDVGGRIEAVQLTIDQALIAVTRRLERSDENVTERVLLICVDIPYALVRRHLNLGQEIPAGVESLIADCAHATLEDS